QEASRRASPLYAALRPRKGLLHPGEEWQDIDEAIISTSPRRPEAAVMGHGRCRPGPSTGCTPARVLLADHEQMPGVLAVYPAGSIDRGRGICGTQSKLLEETLLQYPTLTNRVQVPVLAVGIDHAPSINDWRVYAPFEPMRMV